MDYTIPILPSELKEGEEDESQEGFLFGKRFEGRLLQESEPVERRSNLFAIDVVVVVKKEREKRRNC